MTFLTCPHCNQPIETGLRSGITALRDDFHGIVLTNIDGILEVGNKITAIFEEKHTSKHRIPTYQIITLCRVARRLDVPLYLIFSKDEFVVYEINVNQRFDGKWYYPSPDELILVGELSDFRDWVYEEFIRRAPPVRWIRKVWR